MTEDGLGKLSLGAMFALTEQAKDRVPEILKQAQWCVDRGIPVVPTDGKTPIGGIKAAKLSTKGIKNGYGISLGNGYIGIDYDEHDGACLLDFSETRHWRSGSNLGYGVLYKVPNELSLHGGRIATGVTIRAAGSILVGPGSIHPGNTEKNIAPGGKYTLIDDIEIADAPEWILSLLKTFADRATRPTEFNELIEPEWLKKDSRWLAKFQAEAINGSRSDKTNELAWYSAERGANNDEIAWALSNFKPAVEKYADNLVTEIKRLLGKIREKHAHPGFPCDKAECPNKPAWMQASVEVFDFFSARPELAYIKQAAQARLVAPKSAMLSVLCHIAAAVPVEVVIPPTVGEVTSLNFFACFVGEPGQGKGTSTRLAKSLFNYSQTGVDFITSTPGSGEGVVSCYLKAENSGWKQKHTSALINFDEIDQLKATSERNGSTLSATLRQGFMGEYIGGQYSKTTKELQPLTYRMAFQLSAQPLKSQWLLDDGAGGLPQRFVFVSTTDRDCPDIDDLPDFPESVEWRVPEELIQLKKSKVAEPKEVLGKLDLPPETKSQQMHIEIDESIVREIKLARRQALMGKSSGHNDLVRLKVAALLAILDGRLDVNLDDWKLSYLIMGWSRQATNEIKDALNLENQKIQVARATAAADRAEFIEKRSEQSREDVVKSKILEYAKEGITKMRGTNNIKQKLRKYRDDIDSALDALVREKKVTYDQEKDVLTLTK